MHPPRLPDLNTPVHELARRDFVALRQSETVGEALARVRTGVPAGGVLYFYVIGEDGRLVGVVPVRRLLLSHPWMLIDSVMVRPVLSVRSGDTFERALEILLHRRFLALPVVDAQNRLEGVIDVSGFAGNLVDLERESSEAIFQLAGIHIERARARPLAGIMFRRFPWLLFNIASGLGAAAISQSYAYLLRSVVALAFFVPLLLTMAESIAMQSATISLSRLHAPGGGEGIRGILHEVRAGTIMGLAASAIVGLIAMAWMRAWDVAAIIAAGITAAGAIAALLGFAIPRLVRKWKLNPFVASGPVALAVTDVASLAAYFGLAAWILG